jgi:peroxin-16
MSGRPDTQTSGSLPAGSSGKQSTTSPSPRWLHLYDEFITKNAHQVSQIESALRSLTYIIPGTGCPPRCARRKCADMW